ncbi:PREDICTED: trichoplein keratin filament-binding protein-like, partial [Amphimedon queenslandica]
MALPTLKSYYGRPQSRPGTARVSMLAHRRMIADENQERWKENHQYFKSNEARNQKLRVWTSDSCYRGSLGQYNDKIIKEQKERKLENRRGKLRELLNKETIEYEEELKALTPDQRKIMKERKEEELKKALENQLLEVKEREEEAAELEKKEFELVKEKIALEDAEGERRELERKQKQQDIGRRLMHQVKAQLRRKSQQVQESLRLDIEILERLAAEENERKENEEKKKEKQRLDAQEMRDIMRQQLELERQREKDLDDLYREEAERQWSHREAEWGRERRAREALMAEVIEGRQQQLEEKIAGIKREQLENIERREELLKKIEEGNQLTAREEKKKHDQQKKLTEDLQSQ